MTKGRDAAYLVVLATLLLPRIAAAQSAGAIAGTVRDATGGVLPGVTVEAISPALIEGARSAFTDEQGQYRIIDLRPGVYTLTFALAGFSTVKREDTELFAGFTAAVNADLRIGSVEETVTVTGASPIVDVQNVTQQRVMAREVIDAIPTGKLFSNLAVLVPGMTVRGSGPTSVGLQDVGGQSGNPVVRLGIHGSGTSDQQIAIDGYAAGNLSGQGDGVFQTTTRTASLRHAIHGFPQEAAIRSAAYTMSCQRSLLRRITSSAHRRSMASRSPTGTARTS